MSAPELVRLRPIVHATTLPTGLHLRGWASSFTVGGGAGIARIWQALAPRLADGIAADELAALSTSAPVQAAITRLVAELERHDMVVRVPAGWAATDDPTHSWLAAVADRPDRALARLHDTSVEIDGDGPVGWALARALRAIGMSARIGAGDGRTDHVRATAGDVHVRAAADDVVGCVLAPGSDQLAEITARLRLGRRVHAPSALHALVGSAAAHRLACAVAGLPDPGHERGARGPAHGADPVAPFQPTAVFVARMDPLRGDYRPWLGCDPVRDGTDGSIDDAVARLDAAGDPELGWLAEPARDELPQTPAGIACVQRGATLFRAVATTTDVARLAAATAAIAAAATAELGTPVHAGATALEARGRALRASWLRQPCAAAPLDEAGWAGHPAARRWWKAVTLRFGLDARVVVQQAAPGVHRARVELGARAIGEAVEATAGDAVAFAALAATGWAQWREHDGQAPATLAAPCGATPARTRAGAVPIGWPDDAWTWPAAARDDEDEFAARLGDGRVVRAVAADVPRSHHLAVVTR